jgi:hypothetical protein
VTGVVISWSVHLAILLPPWSGALSSVLEEVPAVVRTFVLATVAVPIVMYGLMPRLHRLRVRLLARRPG